jgi:hypothetical protein
MDITIISQLVDILYLRKLINIIAIINRVAIAIMNRVALPHVARRQEACCVS